MITGIEVEGFKGIGSAKLDGLRPITVFVGPNNSGKTTLLEALALGHAPSDTSIRVGSFSAYLRGQRPGPLCRDSWFHSRDEPRQFKVSITLDADEKTRIREYVFSMPGPGGPHLQFSSMTRWPGGGAGGGGGAISFDEWSFGSPPYLDTDQFLFTSPERATDEHVLQSAVSESFAREGLRPLVELLQPVVPGIRDLRLLRRRNEISLHIETDQGSWPAMAAGDGTKRLLLLAALMATYPGRTYLLEEPDVFHHFSALRQLVRVLWSATRTDGTQIFLTTHSIDLLLALVDDSSTEARAEDIVVVVLENRQGNVKARYYGGEQVRAARNRDRIADTFGFKR